jgi:hypothetical protein
MEAIIRRATDAPAIISRVVLVVSVAVGAACQGAQPRPASPADAAPAAHDPFTRDAFEYQPEMNALRQRVRPEDTVSPATTSWQPSTEPVPAVTAATPGALLGTLVDRQGWAGVLGEAAWEETLRVLPAGTDAAEGIVLQWGFMDDAVAGRDVRIRMRLQNGMWSVERMEQRYHCRRGVTADQRCR